LSAHSRHEKKAWTYSWIASTTENASSSVACASREWKRSQSEHG